MRSDQERGYLSMRITIRQGRVQTRYGRRGHVQVGACVWVHPSSLRTVPVLSHTHHHLFRARLSRSSVRRRRNSVGCRRKAYVDSAAAYLPSNVALVLERIEDTDDG
ncbi:hypothetical protein L208DRAFT_1406221 [Tricholoma matsutake]|nr:hypothetical protein L208DRAFT_1406221 [Tricholoma matsutake 945]